MKSIHNFLVFTAVVSMFFSIEATAWDYPLAVDVTEIKFYHGSTGSSLHIKVNNSVDIIIPEFDVSPSRNERFAYEKSATPKVKARFFSSNPDPTTPITIRAVAQNVTSDEFTAYTGWSLGNTSISYVSVPEPEGTFDCSNGTSVPTSVGKWKTKWSWQIVAVGGSSYLQYLSNTTHDYYTVLATPQSPMAEPWTDVLDRSCDWASGKTSDSEAAAMIVQKLYTDLGLVYDVYDGSPTYTNDGYNGDFRLSEFLNDTPGSGIVVNCYDMGKAVTIFGNSIGCNLKFNYGWPFCGNGFLNCIKPIGRGWTNNPFYNAGYPISTTPVLPGDTSDSSRSKFGNHAFAMIGSNVYDATLKVDTDNDPDDGPYYQETWMTGENWDYYYKTKVIDDNGITNPVPSSIASRAEYMSWTAQ